MGREQETAAALGVCPAGCRGGTRACKPGVGADGGHTANHLKQNLVGAFGRNWRLRGGGKRVNQTSPGAQTNTVVLKGPE